MEHKKQDLKSDIGQFIKKASHKFNRKYNPNLGFGAYSVTLKNDSLSLHFCSLSMQGENKLSLDVFTNPIISVKGGMNPHDKSIRGFYASNVVLLNYDKFMKFGSTYVCAGANKQDNHCIREMAENESGLNLINDLRIFSKECRKEYKKSDLIGLEYNWFNGAADLLWAVCNKSDLYKSLRNKDSCYKM